LRSGIPVDTRTKILTAEGAQAAARRFRQSGIPVKLVAGFFDPLQAAHARRLEEIAQGEGALFVVIDEPEAPLLAARARAELVAGLAVVDCVVLSSEPLAEIQARLAPDAVFAEQAADERRRQELIDLIRSRCG
jgi:hypothetical protein